MKIKKYFWKILLIILLVTGSAWIARPSTHGEYLGKLKKTIEFRRGLDLAGGTHLVYKVDLSKVESKDKANSVQGVKQTIVRRIDALGVTEPTIQDGKVGNDQTIIIELPGITDTKKAIDLIGKTALLEFYEQPASEELAKDSPIPGLLATKLNGSHLIRADLEFQDPTNQKGGLSSANDPVVRLNFNTEGRRLFAEITKRNLSKPVGIGIDSKIISAPTVQSEITDGVAIISGDFSLAEAKDLVIALNSGALPVPVELISEQTIGATLGSQSIQKSILAGAIGIILIMFFMISYYGIKGIFASISLIIYTLLIFAIFKLIPVTITLSGIAGLILSIGAAVDANILIFERMKEELHEGKQIQSAIDIGFKRAWNSIRDSNFSSLMTSGILLWFGTGIVKGFAITLMIGIIISMFSAITISQTMLKLFLRNKTI